MNRFVKIGGWLLLPLAFVSFELSLRHPERVETWYAQGLYPTVASLFSLANPWRVSVAELLLLGAGVIAPLGLYLALRGRSATARVKFFVWTLGWALGLGVWIFLALWGFNYARPALADRMGLARADIDASDVLEAGRRTARRAAALHRELGQGPGPTRLPMSFDELGIFVDALYRELELPGDVIEPGGVRAKPLASSEVFSYLGISGIFVPFTGEPSVNALQPDPALPMVVAHEKAHQRGITDEGEANFAAFLVNSQPSAPLYLRYAAYLFATRYLLGEASRYASEEDVRDAWTLLGEGPLADLRAMREFWERYQGRAMVAASRVNDRYLRAMRVEGGLESYGTVVSLLMALDARGEL